MSAFEDFVNLELPRRSAFLTKVITGHDANPNTAPPAILSGAPLGSWFREETAAKWWRKTEATWEEQNVGGGGGSGSGVVLTQRVDATAGPAAQALPSAAAYSDNDLAVVIETSGLNLVSVSPDGSETINGSASDFVVPAQGSVLLMSDGVSNWDVVAEYAGPGPASAASTVQGDLYACLASVSVRDAVYLSAADTVDKADADGVGTQPLIGFVVSKPTTTTCRVIYYGEIPGFSGLTIGVNYFLSETAGGITITAPTVGGSIIQKVGFARSATTLVIFIDRDYFEN
jgi:hypothetical protein